MNTARLDAFASDVRRGIPIPEAARAHRIAYREAVAIVTGRIHGEVTGFARGVHTDFGILPPPPLPDDPTIRAAVLACAERMRAFREANICIDRRGTWRIQTGRKKYERADPTAVPDGPLIALREAGVITPAKEARLTALALAWSWDDITITGDDA